MCYLFCFHLNPPYTARILGKKRQSLFQLQSSRLQSIYLLHIHVDSEWQQRHRPCVSNTLAEAPAGLRTLTVTTLKSISETSWRKHFISSCIYIYMYTCTYVCEKPVWAAKKIYRHLSQIFIKRKISEDMQYGPQFRLPGHREYFSWGSVKLVAYSMVISVFLRCQETRTY